VQTYNNLQIIVVNDGSIDNSLQILNTYNDDRLQIITKENGGLSSARNEGLKYVVGDYILFIDSDDWIHLNMINVM
jgi:Glycosyltransferases involved in cell wall biogenesis